MHFITMDYVIGLIVAAFLAFIGRLLAMLVPIIGGYLKSRTRNEHIQSAISFAQDAVSDALKAYNSNEAITQAAVDNLTTRLKDNKLGAHFTTPQIESYVYKALHELDEKPEVTNGN